jgi:hypothetical protein
MQFTRYLYERKEVEASFVNTMLKKSTNHAIFWIMELFLSGWHQETIDLLWCVYYDFYYVYNSTLERKLHNLLKTPVPTMKSILITTTTLLSLKHSTHTHELRMIYENYTEIDVNIIYKHLPNGYKKYKNKHFARSVERGHVINVAHHLQSTGVEGLLPDIKLLTNVSVIKKLHTKHPKRHRHMLVARLNKCMLLKQNKGIKIQTIVLSEITQEQEEMIRDEETAQPSTEPCKDLTKRRQYAIDDDIGMHHFFLSRFSRKSTDCNQTRHNMYLHWEYYAFETPIWRERFDHHKAIQNHETKEIVFPTEEAEEEFYQKYGYEPDEQPRETDEKSTKDVEEINYKEWIDRVITCKPN